MFVPHSKLLAIVFQQPTRFVYQLKCLTVPKLPQAMIGAWEARNWADAVLSFSPSDSILIRVLTKVMFVISSFMFTNQLDQNSHVSVNVVVRLDK